MSRAVLRRRLDRRLFRNLVPVALAIAVMAGCGAIRVATGRRAPPSLAPGYPVPPARIAVADDPGSPAASPAPAPAAPRPPARDDRGDALERARAARRAATAAPVDAQPRSALATLEAAELRVLAVEELMGIGNGEQVSRPDPTEAEVHAPVMAHGYADQVVLGEKVFRPILKDKAMRRQLAKAMCEWALHRNAIAWTRSVGEALDAGKCDARFGDHEVYTNPALKLALAEILLDGHPRRAELRNAVILHIARTRGGKSHVICYRTRQTSEETPAVDAPCAAPWDHTWNGDKWVMSVVAYFFEPGVADQISMGDLDDAIWFLGKADLAAPGADAIKAELERLQPLVPARSAKRTAGIAARRASNPALIPQRDVDDGKWTYLWHRLCGEVVHDRRREGDSWIESDMVCVAVTYEQDTGCREIDYSYRRVAGATRWHWFGTRRDRTVPCP